MIAARAAFLTFLIFGMLMMDANPVHGFDILSNAMRDEESESHDPEVREMADENAPAGDVLEPDPQHQRRALLSLALVAALAIWGLLHLVQELDADRSQSF